MIKRVFSRMGIGAARVDLILGKEEYTAGEMVAGYFLLVGGMVKQEVKRIDCDLMRLDKETGTAKAIESITILSSRSVEPKEMVEVRFNFRLPMDLEASSTKISYWFKTKLHFDEGVSTKDQDVVCITEKSEENVNQ
jgi:sporulation-control protein